MFSCLKVGFSGSSIVGEGRVEGDKTEQNKICINCTAQLGISCLAEQAVNAIIYATDKDIKEYQFQDTWGTPLHPLKQRCEQRNLKLHSCVLLLLAL